MTAIHTQLHFPNSVSATCLLDTGATHGSYITESFITEHPSLKRYIKPSDKCIRLADNNTTVQSMGTLCVPVSVAGYDSFHIELQVIPSLSYDVIIGLPDIIDHLFDFFMSTMNKVKAFCSKSEQLHALSEGTIIPSAYSWDDFSPIKLDTINAEVFFKPFGENFTDAPELDIIPEPAVCQDMLAQMEAGYDASVAKFFADIEANVTKEFADATDIIRYLKTDALSQFVPTEWKGLQRVEPLHLEFIDLPKRIKPKARPINPRLFADTEKEWKRLLTYMYRPSSSPYASPLVVVPKATIPFIRICGDYKVWVNKYIIAGHFPMPNVKYELNKAAGFLIFLDIDLTNAFHQIPITWETGEFLSLQTPWGQFSPIFLPEGVSPAMAQLQQTIRAIFEPRIGDWSLLLFDNILILCTDYDDAFCKFKIFIEICKEYNVILKMAKTHLGVREVEFFGYLVSGKAYRCTEDRLKKLRNIPFPEITKSPATNRSFMRSFLGAMLFCSPFLPDFSRTAAPLYDMTKDDFNWDESTWKIDYRTAFDNFKEKLSKACSLFYPDYTLTWILRVDASKLGLGGVLLQLRVDGNTVRHEPIIFFSKKFSSQASDWKVIKQEGFAIFYCIHKADYFLRAKPFIVETDHNNLRWMEASEDPIIVRMVIYMRSFNFAIRHIKGILNITADFFSRYAFNSTIFEINAMHDAIHAAYNDILQKAHSGSGCHLGIRRTMQALDRHYSGHGFSAKQVREFVLECPVCQKARLLILDKLEPRHLPLRANHPNSMLGMDLLSLEEDEDGYKLLCVIINLFDKFVDFYPLKDKDKYSVARAYFSYMSSYGYADKITSDQGPEFMNDVMNELNLWFGTNHQVSLADRHESCGAEPSNREVLRHVRTMFAERRIKKIWSRPEILGAIKMVMNSEAHRETGGIPPYILKFGNKFSRYYEFPSFDQDSDILHSQYVQNLNDHLSYFRAKVSHYKAMTARKRDKIGTKQNFYQPGDFVFKDEVQHGFRVLGKIHANRSGPYLVIKQERNNVFLKNIVTGDQTAVPVDKLDRFYGTFDEAFDLAMTDTDQFVVTRILGYCGDPMRKTSCEFMLEYEDGDIRWRTFSAKDLFNTPFYNEFCSSRPECLPLRYTMNELKTLKKNHNTSILKVTTGTKMFVDIRYFDQLWFAEIDDTSPTHFQDVYVIPFTVVSIARDNKSATVRDDYYRLEFTWTGWEFLLWGQYRQLTSNMHLIDPSDEKYRPPNASLGHVPTSSRRTARRKR